MYIYIRDNDYKKRIKRFTQFNYSAHKSLRIIDDLNLIDSRQSNLLLTDDLSINRSDINVHHIVDGIAEGVNQHSKYQNFKQLLDQIDGRLTNSSANGRARMILVTSLVGGVGKSTVAQNITKIVGKKRHSLLLKLYAPKISSKNTLSEFVITQRHNRSFNLKDYVSVENELHQVDGFFAAEELADEVITSIFDNARNLFDASVYQEIIIDAPPLPHCKALTHLVDHVYLVRSEQRFVEEEKIVTAMQLTIKNWSQIINNVNGGKNARCLPPLDNDMAYQVALSNILIEDGLYEY